MYGTTNADVREKAKAAGVFLWQAADGTFYDEIQRAGFTVNCN